MSEERIRTAESFLHEAVYQSRARQAAVVGLSAGSAKCGLGAETAIDLELTDHGEELFKRLWPRQLAPTELIRIQDVMKSWVEVQDAIDRKRNHFLRDFRQSHGFDRRAYTTEQAREFEDGLEKINTEGNEQLRKSAEALLADAD